MKRWTDVEPLEFVRRMREGGLSADQVIDVREQPEWDYYHLEQTTLMPMNTIPGRIDELPRDKPLYIICAHGVRSEAVCRYLHERGFGGLQNVLGGMAAVASHAGFEYD
ncbi:rhodanese-like domain-containing protein [Paenibacillus humicola]|uniref:rhodanese-like domain-containing protein n=1 Tax=Paenibacillus humicola TaxID=3110540 RepID=UPI00237AC4CB|nr:rhodanese-like domain-containing protein [Paenibacillus humicola]